jgi:hypothetical protein
MIDLLSRISNAQKATSYDGRIMRMKGEDSAKCAGKSAIPPDEIMISPLGVESQFV